MSGVITHAFLDEYPVKPKSRILILGTLHPDKVESFRIPFFYGNRSSLWKLFAKAYPEEGINPYALPTILEFLHRHRIAVSDVIRRGERRRTRWGDGDLRVLEYNEQITKDLIASEIHTVVCTGGNHSKGVFGIFVRRILELEKPLAHLDLIEGIHTEVLGRELRICAMPSPSGAANRGIAASPHFKKWNSNGRVGLTVEDYKVYALKRIFDPLLDGKTA